MGHGNIDDVYRKLGKKIDGATILGAMESDSF